MTETRRALRRTLPHSVGPIAAHDLQTRSPDSAEARGPRDPLHEGHGHLLGLYESDDYLIESVVDFVVAGMRNGEPALVVATGAHIEQLEGALAEHGLDVAGARRDGMLVTADAAETLAGILVDDVPAPARLRSAYDRLRARTAPTGRIRIFAEMVALLWDAELVEAAIGLEDLWNELAEATGGAEFVLFCAYPAEAFVAEQDGFRFVCRQHTAVLPSESYSQLPSPEARLRAVALLQQEANAGGRERLELLRKQRELEAALERLRELDRLRNEFVAMVVHDIRSPATVTTGLLRILRDELPNIDPDEVGPFLDQAIDNAERIERLAGDILTVSQLEAGEFTFALAPIDLGALVVRAAAQVQRSTGREIRVGIDGDLADAYADPDRQAQILGNLLSNAVKFSPPDAPVGISIVQRESRLAVSVRDGGDGIAPEQVEQLFRPFSRVGHRRIGGTGLGLYTTKALVEGQGGAIWVDSSPGEGSTFTYTVPTA